jgi:hypothetical protein
LVAGILSISLVSSDADASWLSRRLRNALNHASRLLNNVSTGLAQLGSSLGIGCDVKRVDGIETVCFNGSERDKINAAMQRLKSSKSFCSNK